MATPILEFYQDKTVLITGATGFVGKVLLEKLLFSVGQRLRRIYIVVRAKNGADPGRRLLDLLDSPVFAGTKRTPRELCLEKVVALAGDIAEDRLGLSEHDWGRLLDEVQVIVHSAASVRFDDPLVKALRVNCLSTMSCLELLQKGRQVQSYVHVSTVFANCQQLNIEERVYPMRSTCEHLLEVSKTIDPNVLDRLARDNLYEGRPNSYVFSKALAEQHLNQHAQGLPVAIARLSVVLPARHEPEPGFLDVLQAFAIVGYLQSLGVLRTFDYDPKALPQGMSVDMCASAIIVLGQLTATKFRQAPEPRVYNITNTIFNNQVGFEVFTDMAQNYPTISAVRPPVDLSRKPSRLYYQYQRWVSEWLFVLVIDLILSLFGYKYKLRAKMRKLDQARLTLQKFTCTDWVIQRDNFLALDGLMADGDRKALPISVADVYAEEVIEKTSMAWKCLKKYKLGEDPDQVDKARDRINWLRLREAVLNLFMYGLAAAVLWLLYRGTSMISAAVL